LNFFGISKFKKTRGEEVICERKDLSKFKNINENILNIREFGKVLKRIYFAESFRRKFKMAKITLNFEVFSDILVKKNSAGGLRPPGVVIQMRF
jgi:hypothetical protein